MIDRLISGAGAWADWGDRVVRRLTGGAGGPVAQKPGSVLLAVVMLVGAAFLAYLGVEGASNPTPVSVSAQEVHDTADFGSRTYATVDGRVSFTYIETYEDENDNKTQDEGEDSLNWYYYLLDVDSGEGVAVRSARSPDDVYRYQAAGTLVSDAEFVKPDLDDMGDVIAGSGVTMEEVIYVDASGPAPADAAPIDFANLEAGAAVSVAGTGFGWLYWCTEDVNGNNACDDDEVDQHDILVYDPATRRGIVVNQAEEPAFLDEAFTGMLRRDAAAVEEATTADNFDFATTGITVSDTYLLAEGDAPASPVLVFPIAGLLVVIGGIMLIGVAGGYLVYRRQTDARSVPRLALETGQDIPLRVTGTLMSAGGLVHVRQAPAMLRRVPVGQPAEADAADAAEAAEAAEATDGEPVVAWESPAAAATPAEGALWGAEAGAPAVSTPSADGALGGTPAPIAAPVGAGSDPAGAGSDPVAPEPASFAGEQESFGREPSTLIIERVGAAQGIAVGAGEAKRLSVGRVFPFRGARPAIRLVAGSGPLLLAFDEETDRDRAATELAAESGMTRQGDGTATLPLSG